MSRLKDFFSRLSKIIRNPAMLLLPGNLAFFIVLALFPILTLIGVIISFFGMTFDISFFSNVLPSNIVDILTPYIQGKGFDSNVGIFMIIGFIMASNGADAIVLASNSLYDIPNTGFFKRRIKDFLIILLIIFIFVFLLAFFTFGNLIFKLLLNYISVDVIMAIYKIFLLLRWPTAIIIIYLNVKLIYILAPDSKIKRKTTTEGAIFTTIAWSFATALFSYYVNHFSNYDIFYGSLSNIIILVLWIYILSYILVIGIAINVGKDKKEEKENELENKEQTINVL